jgi:uncharacterized membrane protein
MPQPVSLISPEQSFVLLGILALIAWIGVTGDRRGWFKKISGVLVAMTISAILSSLRMLPSAAEGHIPVAVYDGILQYGVMLAIPLLLIDVNLKKIIRESGRMLGIFFIGAAGVMLGGLVAGWATPLAHAQAWKLGGILTGTYIGGSMNFMALSSMYSFTADPLFASAVAADNILTNVYLFLLLLLPGWQWLTKRFAPWKEPVSALPQEPGAVATTGSSVSLTEKLLLAITVSALLVAVGKLTGGYIQQLAGSDTRPDVLCITLLSVVFVNLFPRWVSPLKEVGFDAGLFMLYLFLAVVGTNADFTQLHKAAPPVFLMVGIIMGIHLLVVLVFGRWLGYSIQEIGLSSCANISGPPVCVPLAAAYGTRSLVTPVILVAILGYAIGNLTGFVVGWILR